MRNWRIQSIMRVASIVITGGGGAADYNQTAGVDRNLKYEFCNFRKKVGKSALLFDSVTEFGRRVFGPCGS
jgi:hypothetical protein